MPASSAPVRPLRQPLRFAVLLVMGSLVLLGLHGATASGGTNTVGIPGCATPPIYGVAVNSTGQPGSGGRAVAYRSDGRPVTDHTVTSRAPDARLLHTGFGGWEPTLGIRPDGAMFYAGRNSNLDPTVIRSTDRGATWQSAKPCTHSISLDPYLWLDPDTGRIFDSDIGATITCSPVSYSDDSGDSWLTSAVCGEADNQIMFGGPPPAGGPAPVDYPN
ncbi:MAG TPA: hypothetical protein VKA30_10945, partial [Actinomycetota bacterium]|nr:hypothetical protein [Actinomycetota bacterium]